jgi:hypothetical protein
MSEALRIRVEADDPPAAAGPEDASIPLLTERLAPPRTLPPLDLDITLPPRFEVPEIDLSTAPTAPVVEEVVVVPPVAETPPAPPAAKPTSPVGGEHWTRIEIELRESVLKTLSEQLPQDVEDIVQRHVSATAQAALRETLEPLIGRLAMEARLALASSLREIVDRAVKAELTRLKALRPK